MGICPKFMNKMFGHSENSVYSLRSGIQLEKPSIHTVQFRSESTVYKSKMGSRNFHRLGWFCKVITSCWSPLLLYFLSILSESAKIFF